MEPSQFESSTDARRVSPRWPLAATGLAALFVAALAGIFYYQRAYLPRQRAAADVNAESAAAAAAKKAADERTAVCHTDYDQKNYPAAVRSCREAATLGDIVAQRYLGLMCHSGLGIQRNDRDAVDWLRKAAASGDAQAQINLAAMYRDGAGVKRDYAEALKWYRQAATLGIAEAQFNLGVMIYNGYGVERDYAEAVSWFRLAATQGNADAQKMLIEAEDRMNNGPTNQAAAGYFTVGSSKAQVLALQGTPTSIRTGMYPQGSEEWSYDRCSVAFNALGLVTAYSNTCGRLHVSQTPVQHFTIGSSKAQVLAIQGTPTSVQTGFGRGSEQWSYNGCSVNFDESGRVTGYSNMCGELHVEMGLPTNRGNRGNGDHVKVDRYSNEPDYDSGDDQDQ
jgi:TPR repeat protein